MEKSINAQLIVKAIRTGLSLEPTLRRAYSYSLEADQHKFPLRPLEYPSNLLDASRFFADSSNDGGVKFLGQLEHLALLNQEQFKRSLTPDEEAAYLEYYELLFRTMLPLVYQSDNTFSFMSQEDILAFLRIKQWNRLDYPKASFLQKIAARMVRMGIDYFQHHPEKLNAFHPGSLMLESILAAFDIDEPEQDNKDNITFIAQALFNQSLGIFPKDSVLSSISETSLYFFQQALSQLFRQIVQGSPEDVLLDIQTKNLRNGRQYMQLLFQQLGEWDDFLQKQGSSENIDQLILSLWEPVYPTTPENENSFCSSKTISPTLKNYILNTWWKLMRIAPFQIGEQRQFLGSSVNQLFDILGKHQLDRPALFIALHQQVLIFEEQSTAPSLESSQSFLSSYEKVLNKFIQLVPCNGNIRKFSNESLADLAKPIYQTYELIETQQDTPEALEVLTDTFISVLDNFLNYPVFQKFDFNFYTQIIDWSATTIQALPEQFYPKADTDGIHSNWNLAGIMSGFLSVLNYNPEQNTNQHSTFLNLLKEGSQVLISSDDIEQTDQILTFMGPTAWDLGAYTKWDVSDWKTYQKALLELLKMQGHLKENVDLFWSIGKALKLYLEPFGEEAVLQLGLKAIEKSSLQLKLYWPNPGSNHVDNHLLIASLKQLQELRPDSPLHLKWTNQLSEQQTLILLQDILAWIEKRPLWIKNKQLQKALSAILVAIPYDGLTNGVPFAILRNCISGILEEVHRPSDWLLAISIEGKSKNYPLTYALQWLFQSIFNQAPAVRIRLLDPTIFQLMLIYMIKTNQDQGVLTLGKIDATALWLNEQINQFAAEEITYEDLLLQIEQEINTSGHFEKKYGA